MTRRRHPSNHPALNAAVAHAAPPGEPAGTPIPQDAPAEPAARTSLTPQEYAESVRVQIASLRDEQYRLEGELRMLDKLGLLATDAVLPPDLDQSMQPQQTAATPPKE